MSIVLAALMDEQSKIPLKWVIPLGIILLHDHCFTWTCCLSNQTSYSTDNSSCRLWDKQEGNSKIICLLDPSPLFSYGTLVSFYYVNEEFEELLGYGRVVNIQDNKLIQAELTYPNSGQGEILEEISQNNSSTLPRLRVKPTITDNYSEAVRHLENFGFGQEKNDA